MGVVLDKLGYPKWSVSQITSWFRRTSDIGRCTPKSWSEWNGGRYARTQSCCLYFPRRFCASGDGVGSSADRAVQEVQRFRLVLLLHEKPVSAMRKQPRLWGCRPGKYNAGGFAGQPAISASKITRAAAGSRLFPPADRALISHGLRNGRGNRIAAQPAIGRGSDLSGAKGIGQMISRSTVWRMLQKTPSSPGSMSIGSFRVIRCLLRKPARSRLVCGHLGRQVIGAEDYVLSSDEKTSIQARRRRHPETPPRRKLGGSKRNTRATGRCSIWRRGMCIAAWSWAVVKKDRDPAVWADGESDPEVQTVLRCGAVVLDRGQWLVPSRPAFDRAIAKARQANHPGAYARTCELVEPGGDLLFDHSAEGADAE